MWAANQATRAQPKDYLGQAAAIYDGFTKRWRYVRDPLFSELVHVSGPALWSGVFGAASSTGYGSGDCDCATAGLAAAYLSTGFPVRLVTSTPPGRRLPAHIYPEIFVKGPNKWIAADPVVWPRNGLGFHTKAIARQRWDLFGRSVDQQNGLAGEAEGVGVMADQFVDYGLAEYGYAGLGGVPEDWATHGLAGFGAYADSMGICGHGMGMLAEVETDRFGLARTPMIELAADDYAYVMSRGAPYHGMAALGDDGTVYQWDGLGGFFSSIFKGAKKLVGGVINIGKKLISKLPGGKYIIKIGEKIHNTAMKLIKPLAKLVGPLARKLAPIAALIPGYGPVISVALKTGGELSRILEKTGVKQDHKGKLHFKSPKQIHAFRAHLKAAAHKKRIELQAKRAGKKAGRGHLPAGAPAHTAALRAVGVKPMAARPMIGPATIAPAPGMAPAMPGMPPGAPPDMTEWFKKMMASYGVKDQTPGGPEPGEPGEASEAATAGLFGWC